MERACMLCRQAQVNLDACGEILQQQGLRAHLLCLFFANEISARRDGAGGVVLLHEEVEYAMERAARRECFVCHQSGATITCRETGCDVSFHLPCATRGGCVTQYFGLYRSFCREHHPQQQVEVVPEEDTTCLICLEPVDSQTSYRTMVCPACQHAWFHRECIQEQALQTGQLRFQCPACRDQNAFLPEMLNMGIQIPYRLPSWVVQENVEELGERHRHCDASECLCPGGREQAEQEGPWQLLLCSSCAAEGTHRQCSHLRPSTSSWECSSCAGPSRDSSDSWQLPDPGAPNQEAGAASSSSSEEVERGSTPGPVRVQDESCLQCPEEAASNIHPEALPSSQMLLVPSHSSTVPETSSPRSPPETPSAEQGSSPVQETGSQAGSRRRRRKRGGSQLQGQGEAPPCRRPRTRRGTPCRARAASQSSSSRQGQLEPSCSSLHPQSSSPRPSRERAAGQQGSCPGLEPASQSSSPGPVQARTRSRLQRREEAAPYSPAPARSLRRRNSPAASPSAGPDPPAPPPQ
ncbi:PHD finger protein 7-like [Melanerpes formicivorus]|uniref:PHD finger protein 7-like n=1 Tax=Melanerpes formicivorus TaxID=211600 RepID=UPI00358E26A9